MSTIRDVARRAGVSSMTVSRVVNRTGYVRPETRKRVEVAVAELGYVPNSLARSLRFKRTKTLALVMTDITNPFFTTLARGVEDVASDHGFNVIFCNTDECEQKQTDYLTVLVQKQVDGVLLVPARSSAEPIQFLQQHGIAVVVLDRRVPGAEVDLVRCDSRDAAQHLTHLLLALGHRRIAMLAGPDNVSTASDRVDGFRRAFAAAGLAAPEELVFSDAYTVAGGRRMATSALAAAPPPTALFAANNFIGIGAYHLLRDKGMRVPEDLSLVAFDDLPPTVALDPFLTVAAQPAEEMGRRATELLLNRLSQNDARPPEEILLPVSIIERWSIAAPGNPSGGG
jgi:LacI family transcriptional regulator